MQQSGVEIEWHFIKECIANEDIHEYKDNLQGSNMKKLFEEANLHKTTSVLIQIYNRRNNLEKSQEAA